MILNNKIDSEFEQDNLTMMCPSCYSLMPLGTIKMHLELDLDPMTDMSMIELCQNFVIGYPLEDYHILTRQVINAKCYKCDEYMIALDSDISRIIKILNQHGYYTIASCAGHFENLNNTTYDSYGYILFADNISDDIINTVNDTNSPYHFRFENNTRLISHNPNGDANRFKSTKSILEEFASAFPIIPICNRKYEDLKECIKSTYPKIG